MPLVTTPNVSYEMTSVANHEINGKDLETYSLYNVDDKRYSSL